MDKKYKWRLLYKPPIEEYNENNIDTWHKVFYINKYECPTGLDVNIKLTELKNLYNMKKEYMILQDLEEINE